MISIPVSEASRRLTQLLKSVESGEDVVITRAGKPIAKLTRPDAGQGDRAEPEPARRLRSVGWRAHPQASVQAKPPTPKES